MAAVVFDVAGAGSAVSSANATSHSHTIAADANFIVAFQSVGKSGGQSYTAWTRTATCGGVAMTPLAVINSNNGTTGWVEAFYQVNPGSGAKTVAVSNSGGTGTAQTIISGSLSFKNVGALSVPVTAFSGVGSAPSVSTPSTVGGIAVAGLCSGGTISAPTQTQRYLNNFSAINAAGNLILQTAAGTGAAVTFSAANNSDVWGDIAFNLFARGPFVGGRQLSVAVQRAGLY